MPIPCFGFVGSSDDCPGVIPDDVYAKDGWVQCRERACSLPARIYQNAVRVDMSIDDMAYAQRIGEKRNRSAKGLGLPDKHGFIGQGDDIHVLGARAELAFARFCGVEWEASNLTFKAPDVGCVQVRGRTRLGYDLIVRKDDSDRQPFVLVVGENPFYVVGWTTGSLAKQESTLTHGGREAAHFVPKSKLMSPRIIIPIARDPLIVEVVAVNESVRGYDAWGEERFRALRK